MNIFKFKKGFTLIELLVVISIISLLASVVLSSLSSAREKGRMAAGMQFEANILHGIGDQLVGEWKFEDGAGKALDTSSFGNNGVVLPWGGPVWSANSGYNGKGAYFFNGSNSITATVKNLNTNKITITTWIKNSTSANGLYGIVANRAGGINGLVTGQNNELRLAWANGFYNVSTGLSMPVDKWNFIAMSVTPTKVTLYMNNKTYAIVGNFPPINFSAVPFNFGKDSGQGGIPGGSYLDNVRIYTAPITAMDIQNIYAEGLSSHQDLALTK